MNENISSLILEIDIKRERLRNIPSFKRRRVIKGYPLFIRTITTEYHTLLGIRGWFFEDTLTKYLDRLNDYLALFENA